MSESSICPKCGFPRTEGTLECPVCGIVYDRYNPERVAAHRPTPPPPPPPPAAGYGPAVSPPESWSAPQAPPAPYQPPPADGTFNPYQAPAAPIAGDLYTPSPYGPDSDLFARPLASRGTRLGAVIVDALIYGVCLIPVFAIIGLGAESADSDAVAGGAMILLVLIFLALFIVNLYFLNRDGQTLGKKALGVRIVRMDDSRASLGRIFWLRMVVPGILGGIPILGPFFSLADALLIFAEDRRCIHDHIADTKVVLA